MNIRKMLSVVLTVCILISSLTITFAADTDSTETKADALNTVGLLSGDGSGNFNLTSSLKRSEAATFIVKLMGKSAYLDENKDDYIETGFSDVDSTAWYAAYIGFCKENSIVSGYEDGTFGPKESVTEKAFLTMVMKALGYTSEDFSWNTVYSKAYEIGLVTGDEYATKEIDNTFYTRADVVEVMTTALGLKIKDSSVKLIKKLIQEGQVDSSAASSAGLIYDELPSAVSEIVVKSGTWVEIEFNEAIEPVDAADITLYQKDSKAALKFEAETISDSKLKLITGAQTKGTEYVLTFENVCDMEGNIVKSVTSDFVGFENKEIESDMFKISKVEQISSSEIGVYFTHPINANAEQSECFSILDGENVLADGNEGEISAKLMEGVPNALIISISDFTIEADKEYTVKATGSLLSEYGTYLYHEAGDQMNFIGSEMDEAEQFDLVDVTALSNQTIQLDFNRPVYQTTAEQVFSYYITEQTEGTPIQITNAAVTDNDYGDGCGVILTTEDTLDNEHSYNIMINHVSDLSKENSIEEQSYSFDGVNRANAEIDISKVKFVDLNSIIITFDKKIDPTSAEDTSNYSIVCVGNTTYTVTPVNAVYSSDSPYSVKLYISYEKPMSERLLYKVKIAETFKDFTGTALEDEIAYNFNAKDDEKDELELTKAVFIDPDTVKVTFSGDIAQDKPNINKENYYIQVINGTTKKIPIAITYIDGDTIVLKFDKIDLTKDYYFKYDKIKDMTNQTYSGSNVNMEIVTGE